jgi:hypothetical protein
LCLVQLHHSLKYQQRIMTKTKSTTDLLMETSIKNMRASLINQQTISTPFVVSYR